MIVRLSSILILSRRSEEVMFLSRIPKCPRCNYSHRGEGYIHYALKRIYLKRLGRWVPIGWICPRCGGGVVDIKAGSLGKGIPAADVKMKFG